MKLWDQTLCVRGVGFPETGIYDIAECDPDRCGAVSPPALQRGVPHDDLLVWLPNNWVPRQQHTGHTLSVCVEPQPWSSNSDPSSLLANTSLALASSSLDYHMQGDSTALPVLDFPTKIYVLHSPDIISIAPNLVNTFQS